MKYVSVFEQKSFQHTPPPEETRIYHTCCTCMPKKDIGSCVDVSEARSLWHCNIFRVRRTCWINNKAGMDRQRKLYASNYEWAELSLFGICLMRSTKNCSQGSPSSRVRNQIWGCTTMSKTINRRSNRSMYEVNVGAACREHSVMYAIKRKKMRSHRFDVGASLT